ncbi:glycoside hydrolase family 10 protein [Candidatus Latescibacterota bacterium]
MRPVLIVFGLYILFFPGTAFCEPEVRGLWVVRDTITSSEEVRTLVDFADKHHFNVLFVQVRGRGDAFYQSYFVPGPDNYPSIPDSFDPLEEVITLAHTRNIEVHAWFNMYLTWSSDKLPVHPDHPLNKHPEWFMVSKDGKSMATCSIEDIRNENVEGRYLSPVLEEVRGYLSRVITEVIVTYNVDGIHLDYVRYPGREYDFHPKIRQDFSERYGVDPHKVVWGDGQYDPTLMYLGMWVESRAEQIDEQVKSIKRRIKLVDSNIRLSAAVKPHADEAYYHFGQNWVGWLNEGIVDFVVTMSYFPETEKLFEVMSANVKSADRKKIIGGIGTYLVTPEKTADQISLIRQMDLLGYCLFSYTVFLENSQYGKRLDTLVPSNSEKLPQEFKPYLRNIYE